MILGMLLNLLKPWFSHLENWVNNNLCLKELTSGLNGIILSTQLRIIVKYLIFVILLLPSEYDHG